MATVLISGASVAGLTLAAWLERYGFTVTVVERNPGLRRGGQAIDVRGPALQVLERLGVIDAVSARRTAIRGMSFVDGQGRELMRDTASTLTGGTIANPDIEVLRDDLLGGLYGENTSARFLFDDTITDLRQSEDSVAVNFSRSRPSVSFPEPLNCGVAGCLTSCHLSFFSYSCHFFSATRHCCAMATPAARVGACTLCG
jgi:2-polyprenyl-6-methoxyphenol hydroxylase-like FAD-dependent oxidoreductase